jgi:hypothetical protein
VELVKRKCLQCYKIFFTPPGWGSGKFCSVRCYHEHGRITRKCAECGKKFVRPKSHRSLFDCCSRRCLHKKRMRECRVNLKCPQCHKKFWIPRGILQRARKKRTGRRRIMERFCSLRCRRRWYTPKERRCLLCKKKFWVRRCVLRAGGGKYCSYACYTNYRNKKRPHRQKKASRPCKKCGKAIFRYPSQFKQGKGQFCSRACHMAKRAEKERVSKICKKCGKRFTIAKGRLRFVPAKYCSKKCAGEALKNKVPCKCPMCNADFERIPSRLKRGVTYCSSFCESVARKIGSAAAGRARMVYTPELLQSLLNPDSAMCLFPDCQRSRAKRARAWALCKVHLWRMNHALRRRRQSRERFIQEAGLAASVNID